MKENRNELLTVGEIAEILGVNKNIILHYDRKGLISSIRSDNNYRYYYKSQISSLREILSLRKIGFSIEKVKKIKNYVSNHDYNMIFDMIEQKEEEYKKEIENIERNRKILESYKRYMEYENNFFSAGKRREDGIFDIQNFSEEKYTVFDLGRGEKEKNTEKYIIRELKKYNCSGNILKKYFFGYIISQKNYLNFDYNYSKFFLKNDVELCRDKYIFKKGSYAVFYIKAEKFEKNVFEKFFEKIKENGYKTEGDMFIENVSIFDRTAEEEDEIIILKIMVKSLTSE